MVIDKTGPVTGASLYRNGEPIGEDANVTLPALSFLSADLRSMGSMSFPIVSLLENMEATISRVGIDKGYSRLITPEMATFEVRWIQTKVSPEGTTKDEGCRAYFRGIPTSIPTVPVTEGEAMEQEVSYAVTRYELIRNGEQILLVDRLNNRLVINGKDYMQSRNQLL